MISFFVLGDPVAKGRPRFARRGKYVHTFTPEKTRSAENTLVARSLEFRPEQPLTCPLRLAVIFDLPIPASWPKWKQQAALVGELFHVSKPDTDNLVKLVKDALNGVFWRDDSQIVSVKAVKRYSAMPATRIEIYELVQAVKR